MLKESWHQLVVIIPFIRLSCKQIEWTEFNVLKMGISNACAVCAPIYIVRTAFIGSACISEWCDKCASTLLHIFVFSILAQWNPLSNTLTTATRDVQNAVTRDHTGSHAWTSPCETLNSRKTASSNSIEQFKNHLDSFYFVLSIFEVWMYDNLLHIIWAVSALCCVEGEYESMRAFNGKWEGERTQIVIRHLLRLAILG